MILKFNVKEQTISLVNTKSVPRIGSKDYLVLQFSFSSDWENLNKFVYLQSGDVSVPHDLVDGSVIVDEYFTEQTEFNVTLFGKSANDSVEVPTNVVSVQLEKSNNLWEKDAPEPQNSWVVQVIDARDEALAAAIRAENAAIRQPYPNAETGTWWVWNAETGKYEDTGEPSRGETGPGIDITGATVGQIAKITAVDDTGKPTAWEAVDMPEQVQTDWNQNDDTQRDYLKNRPFYSETKTVTVENATDVALEGFPVFAVGDTVTVNVDGVEHSLVAYEDSGCATIGDTTNSIDNGEGQFGWQIYVEDDNSVWFYATEAHTVSYLVVVGYHKIDPKYLPDSVISAIDADAYQVRLLRKDLGEWVLERGTYDVIREKLTNGEPINVKIASIYNNYQYFYPVGNIYYDVESMCINIMTVNIESTTKLKIAVFEIKAGGTISFFSYNLQ